MDPADFPVARFATVMNGGVSLAVWMGGVTHEMERLIRCHRNGPTPTVWFEFAESVETRVLIDIVAGTSAGGINGTLLATAIGRGARLPDLKGVWGADGKLQRPALLHKKHLRKPNSILDGRFFADQVSTHLAEVASDGQDEWADDVTLLVTSSALSGKSNVGVDVLGREFRAADHRRVYRFESRASPRRWHTELGMAPPAPLNDFHAAAAELAVAARSSAGFPVAFEPQDESPLLAKMRIVGRGSPSWLIDGGVLDNAPIGALIDELCRKPRVDAGTRWITYVVPTMDAEQKELPTGPGTARPSWTAIPGRLVSLWRESDLRQDVEDLQDLAGTTNTSSQPAEDLINPALSILDDLETVGVRLLTAYRRTRAYQNVVEIDDVPEQLSTRKPLDRTSIDAALATLDLAWIPAAGPAPTEDGTRPALTPRRTFPGVGDRWQWGVSAAQRLVFWMSRDARRRPAQLSAATVEELAKIAWQLDELSGAVRAQRQKVAAENPRTQASLAIISQAYVTSQSLTDLDGLIVEAVGLWAIGRKLPVDAAWARLLATEVIVNATSWDEGITLPPFKFLMISPETPYEETGLHLKNLAENTPGWGSAKLYGTRFGHFGAFVTKEWKEWDWRWGRIDGAFALVDALSKDSKLTADQVADFKNRLLAEILAEEGNMPVGELVEKSQLLATTDVSGLLRIARDSGQVDVDALFDDATSMIQSAPQLNALGTDSWFKRAKSAPKRFAGRRAVWWQMRKLRRKLNRL